MSKLLLIIITSMSLCGVVYQCDAYTYTITNKLSKPAMVEISLAGCIGHDPKRLINPGQTVSIHGIGWAVGCCMSNEPVKVDGKTVPVKIMSASQIESTIFYGEMVVSSPYSVVRAISDFCRGGTFVITEDSQGNITAAVNA
jgi:hypothetical protein